MQKNVYSWRSTFPSLVLHKCSPNHQFPITGSNSFSPKCYLNDTHHERKQNQKAEAKNSWTVSQMICVYINSLSAKVEQTEINFKIGEKAILDVCCEYPSQVCFDCALNSFLDDPLWKSHETSPATPCRSKDTSFRAAASNLECLCWSPLCSAWEFKRLGFNLVWKQDIFSLWNDLKIFWFFSGIICLQLIKK